MWIWLIAALAANTGTIAPEADDGVEIVERRVYYPVHGLNRNDLRAELDAALARRGIDGGMAGRTEQELTTRYELAPLPSGGCRLAGLEVTLHVTITLPRWEPDGEPVRGLRDRWNAMVAALTLHEEGHRDIAVDTARRLYSDLRALDTGRDCQALNRDAQRALFSARLRHGVRDRAYEHRTRHGIAQGARL